MYRLVVDLPFGLMLVHKKFFSSVECAEGYRTIHYKKYPGMKVWDQQEVKACKARIITFPFKAV